MLVYLEKEDAAHIKIGNKLKIKGKASAFETARNPGNFDQRAYYKRQKIGAYVWADEVGILSGQTECIRQFLHEFRQWLEETPCRVFGQLLWKHDKCDPSRRKRRP